MNYCLQFIPFHAIICTQIHACVGMEKTSTAQTSKPAPMFNSYLFQFIQSSFNKENASCDYLFGCAITICFTLGCTSLHRHNGLPRLARLATNAWKKSLANNMVVKMWLFAFENVKVFSSENFILCQLFHPIAHIWHRCFASSFIYDFNQCENYIWLGNFVIAHLFNVQQCMHKT